MVLRGADISHHQNDAGLNLGALLAAVDFVIVKATQGTGYTDARYAANVAAARATGKLCGSYHYAGGTGVAPGNPVAEADHYLSVANHQPGEILVLDYEPAKPPADPDGWCAAFCARVRSQTGVVPLVYMSGSVARAGTWVRTRALGARLWIAQYGTNTGTKPTIAPSVGAWGGYVMWQYTSNGRLPGASGVLDINEFYGDAVLWRALGNPTQQEDDMPLSESDLIKIFDWPIRAQDGGVWTLSQVIAELGSAFNSKAYHGNDDDRPAGHMVSAHKFSKAAYDLLTTGSDGGAARLTAAVAGGDPEALATALKDALGEQLAADVAARLSVGVKPA